MIEKMQSGTIGNLMETISAPLLAWFLNYARILPWREDVTPYRVWISEIMLQQTRVEAVKGYFTRFVKKLPMVKDLAEIQEDELLKLWEGLGYYNRVRNMQKAAQIITNEYEGQFPDTYSKLLLLPGIGSYTAGAVGSIAFGLKEPAVDGNVLRVLARIGGDYSDIADVSVKKRAEEEIRAWLQGVETYRFRDMPVAIHNIAGTMNQALMELGATVCIPNGQPKCTVCPIATDAVCVCEAFKQGTQLALPVKTKKKSRRIDYKTVILIMDDRKTVIRKRPSKGLLAGLYEFPNIEGHLSEKQVQQYTESLGYFPMYIEKMPEAIHIFTHCEWRMQAYIVKIAETGVMENENGYSDLFVNRAEIENVYPVPSAFSLFTKYVKV